MAEIKMAGQESDELNSDVPVEDEDFDGEITDEMDEVLQSVDDLPPEQELWIGGPTAETMKKWMEDYGKVYVTSVSYDEHMVWRPLKRREYAQINSKLEELPQEISEMEFNMVNEELICKMCVLEPDMSDMDFDSLLAGLPTLLSQQILERSGFTAIGLREMI